LQQGSQEEYEEHANKAKTLPKTTTEKNKLIIDRLYKQQSTDGYESQIIEVNTLELICQNQPAVQ
jgi:DNA-binding ferritin-like protein (Dps family)